MKNLLGKARIWIVDHPYVAAGIMAAIVLVLVGTYTQNG